MLLEDTGTDIIDITKPIAKKAAEISAYYSKFKAMDALQLASKCSIRQNIYDIFKNAEFKALCAAEVKRRRTYWAVY